MKQKRGARIFGEIVDNEAIKYRWNAMVWPVCAFSFFLIGFLHLQIIPICIMYISSELHMCDTNKKSTVPKYTYF